MQALTLMPTTQECTLNYFKTNINLTCEFVVTLTFDTMKCRFEVVSHYRARICSVCFAYLINRTGHRHF